MKRSATLTLITIICAAYLVQLLIPNLDQHLFLIKEAILSDGQVHGTAQGEWYRLLTVALTHGGIFHLGFNMYALMVLGNPIEAAFGKERFLVIFFVSLISGSLLSNYLAAANQPSVVASDDAWGFGKSSLSTKDARGTYYAELNATLPIGEWVGGGSKRLPF